MSESTDPMPSPAGDRDRSGRPANHSSRRKSLRESDAISRRTLFGMLAAALAGGWVIFRAMLTRDAAKQPQSSRNETRSAPDPTLIRAAFYDAKVEPKVFETDLLNREAADRAIARLRKSFDRYHVGVDKFVGDLTSLSTRLGIVRRMPGQWWAGDQRIEVYVREKFELHLFSEKRLVDDIEEVLATFQDEIDANQRRMLIEIHAAVSTSDLPQVGLSTYEDFYDAVAKRLQSYSTDQGSATVYNALTVLIVSEAGSFVATSLVAGLLARFGTAAAVSTVAASGATAGSATVGAGGGAFGGPVGLVVGFGVGLAVGLIIDWWMTEKFEAEMSAQMNAYLDSLEHSILHGDAKALTTKGRSSFTGDDASHQGLTGAMPVVCDRLLDAYRERFYEQIVTGE